MKRLLIAFAFLIVCAPTTQALGQRVWIAEFVTQRVEAAAPFANLPSSVRQPNLTLAGGIAQTSAVFRKDTRFIRVVCEVQCAINGTGNPAQASDILLPALKPEYFGVTPGTTISVIAAP